MTLVTDLVTATISGLVFGSLLALTAVGLTLVYGVLDVPNFAQGEFATLAGFSTITLTGLGIGLVPSIAIALGFTFVMGVVTERLVFSHFYESERFFVYSFFASFGLTIFFADLLRIFYSAEFFQIERPDWEVIRLTGELQGVVISPLRVFAAITAIVLLGLLYVFTRRTYVGLAMRALADDKEAVQVTGVDRDRIYMITFGLGALITGMTGILYGMIFSLQSTLGVVLTAFAFIVVVAGGVGSFSGAILASLLIGLVDSFTATFIGSRWRLLVVFIILFVLLVVNRSGIGGIEH